MKLFSTLVLLCAAGCTPGGSIPPGTPAGVFDAKTGEVIFTQCRLYQDALNPDGGDQLEVFCDVHSWVPPAPEEK